MIRTSDPFHEWEVLIAKTAREEVSEAGEVLEKRGG